MELNRKQQIMYDEISNIISNNNGSSLNNRIFDYVNNLQSQLEQKEKQLNDIKEYVEECCWQPDLAFYSNMSGKEIINLIKIIERNNNESKK